MFRLTSSLITERHKYRLPTRVACGGYPCDVGKRSEMEKKKERYLDALGDSVLMEGLVEGHG